MSFFQNPFTSEFRGPLVLGDRAHIPNFICKPNAGRGDENVRCWVDGPFDLSGNDADSHAKSGLVLKYATYGGNYKDWQSLTVSLITGAVSSAAVTAAEAVASLNADANFTAWFSASVSNDGKRFMIKQNKDATKFRFYIVNGKAEEVLKFNSRSGVAELPTFFRRHCVDQVNTFNDCQNNLVFLDPDTYDVDADVIDNAVNERGESLGLDSGTVRADYLLLGGKSGLFQFTKVSDAGADTTKTEIVYSAGAVAGDLAMKVVTEYDGSNNVLRQFHLPYTLTSDDLITPP